MKRPRPIPEAVAALAAEFAAWRSQRVHARAPLPTDLMRKAIEAARVHSVGIVARGVKVDRRRLKVALAGNVSKADSAAQRPRSGAAAVRLLPLQLSAPVTAVSSAVVEIEDPSGWRLRLTCDDASLALKAFMEARR